MIAIRDFVPRPAVLIKRFSYYGAAPQRSCATGVILVNTRSITEILYYVNGFEKKCPYLGPRGPHQIYVTSSGGRGGYIAKKFEKHCDVLRNIYVMLFSLFLRSETIFTVWKPLRPKASSRRRRLPASKTRPSALSRSTSGPKPKCVTRPRS